MKNKSVEGLIIKFISKSISAVELDQLSTWVEEPENKKIFKEYIKINYALDYNMSQFKTEKIRGVALARVHKLNKKKLLSSTQFYKYAAAVAILISLTVSIVLNNDFSLKDKNIIVVELNPGTDKAILTLESGERVVLEKGKKEVLRNVISYGDKIIYKKETLTKNTVSSEVKYNYLTVPRGGQYNVELSDGTIVWLNSESKLKYPVHFIKNKPRNVELIYGEAYFEVSKSTNHNGALFNVRTKTQDIKVLGTEFNIKAYQDEEFVYSTLLEGTVEVSNGIIHRKLVPGEQSVVSVNNENLDVRKVDVFHEIGWKRGVFVFNKETLETMMKTLSRWYNVEIIFENQEKKNLVFSGVLNRTNAINELLSNLEKTKEVEFEINNKTILIK